MDETLTYTADITITAASREDLAELLKDIAYGVSSGRFSACCSKREQEAYGGTVFVTERENA